LYGRPRSLTGSARAGRAVGTARPLRALAGSTAGGDSHPAPKELRASEDRRRPGACQKRRRATERGVAAGRGAPPPRGEGRDEGRRGARGGTRGAAGRGAGRGAPRGEGRRARASIVEGESRG